MEKWMVFLGILMDTYRHELINEAIKRKCDSFNPE